jgi:hypothetical protein
MEDRPKIRVLKWCHNVIKGWAKENGWSMTRQIEEMVRDALVSHPENGKEWIAGMAVVTRKGDLTTITEKTVVAAGRSMGHEVGDGL